MRGFAVLAGVLAVASAAAGARVVALPEGADVPLGRFWDTGPCVMCRAVTGSARWSAGEGHLLISVCRGLAAGEQLRSGGSQDDPLSIFRTSDTVEIFVAPHGDQPDVSYQIAANPSNLAYFAKGIDDTWRPLKPIGIRSSFSESDWTCTFDIPFGAFGEDAVRSGSVWRAEFATGNGSWSGTSECHDARTYGELHFGGKPPRATVEDVTRDADGTVHVSFSARPTETPFDLPHKGVVLDGLQLNDRTETLAEIPFPVPPGDAKLLELDRFYYPVGSVQPQWKSSLFDATAKTSVLQADGTATTDANAVGSYVLAVEDDRHRATSSFETTDGTDVLGAPVAGSLRVAPNGGRYLVGDFAGGKSVPYFPIVGSQNLQGKLTVRCLSPQDAGKEIKDGDGRNFELFRLAYEAEGYVPPKGSASGPVEFLCAAYRDFKARNPGKLFSLHADCRHDVTAFADACDIFETAYFSCSYAPNPLLRIEPALTRALAIGKGKPVVFWIGAAVPHNGRHRTADELNTAVRHCIMRGVAGVVFHLGHGGVPTERTRLWDFMRHVECETAKWYPDWVAGVDDPVSAVAENGIRVAVRRTARERIVLAVNLDPEARCFELEGKKRFSLGGFGSLLLRLPLVKISGR